MELLDLHLFQRVVDFEDVYRQPLFSDVFVHSHDGLLVPVDLFLVMIGRIRDLPLGETLFNGREHASHVVDLLNDGKSFLFHLVGERFHKIRPAQRIAGVGDARLFSDDLLSSERYGGGLFGRDGQHFVQGIGVKRLGSSHDRGQHPAVWV